MPKSLNILFVADIVGEPGMQILQGMLKSVKQKYNIDFCVANGENVCEGRGVSDKDLSGLLTAGVDLVTSGNHIWDTFKSVRVLREDTRILRPANYPSGNPGVGSGIIRNKDGAALGVINIQGRIFMMPIDNPFSIVHREIDKIRKETPLILVDFHAEATAEKIAMGWHLDGKVGVVIGTHTHVQTADERLLPKGTAYITDAGMTGSIDSVIGMSTDVALHRFLYSTNRKYELARENLRFCGVFVALDSDSGKARKIERINLP